MLWSVIREPNDRLAKARVSLGSASLGGVEDGAYMVFRGDTEEVLRLLEEAVKMAKQRLPVHEYDDKRGRPQG